MGFAEALRRSALALLLGAALPAAAHAVPAYVVKAVADPGRAQDDRKLDADRKPAEVLTFAGVKPGQRVDEYLPGGGYYTRMISDVVGPTGKVYALETTTWGDRYDDATRAAVKDLPNVSLALSPLGQFPAPPEKADIFWITLNYHDLHIARYAVVDMAVFNKKVFDALKPGGVYFIIDHAAAPGSGDDVTGKLHRIDKATVIREVEAAGFRLAGESPLLGNPADDHTKVVFDPSIRFKTDQFILKSRKPG